MHTFTDAPDRMQDDGIRKAFRLLGNCISFLLREHTINSIICVIEYQDMHFYFYIHQICGRSMLMNEKNPMKQGERTVTLRYMIIPLTLMIAFVLFFNPSRVYAADELEGGVLSSGYNLEDSDFAERYKDVIEDMRSHLAAHEPTFILDFLPREDLNINDDFIYSLFYYACEHNQDPVQGDYIYTQYQSFSYVPSTYEDEKGATHISITCTPTYFTDQEQESRVSEKARSIIDHIITDEMSDYDRILSIYTYMCENVTYDYERRDDDSTEIEHSAYAALCEGKAVCQGYAAAVYRLMLMAGIDCRVIVGAVDGTGHAWNIVKLDGKYYYMDSTFDAGNISIS